MDLITPRSREDYVMFVSSCQPTFSTPSQLALFGEASLQRTFDSGQRSPATLWATSQDGQITGVLGGRMIGDLALIDLLALPGDDSAHALIESATAWAREHSAAEVSFGAQASPDPLGDPAVRQVIDLFGVHDWRVLVTRSHYEVEPGHRLGAGIDSPSQLDRAGEDDRPRLEALLRRVLPGSLDVRDAQSVAEHGLDRAAAVLAAELIGADPITAIRFAVIDGHDAALASWRTTPDGRGFVSFVGVAAEHRGRGVGRALVAAASRDLVAEGASVLIADTDDVNVPMRRAFTAAGWERTEARIDLVL